MTEDEFVGLVGEALVHVTPASNVPSILRAGLLRPATLARLAGRDPAELSLRRNPVVLVFPGGAAVLNHQRPLRAGRAADFLEGVSLERWALMLDERLFFWPGTASERFLGSVEAREPSRVLHLDARGMFRAFGGVLDLAPINTGSATRKPVRRGSWIYTPALGSVQAFREARRARGLVQGRDAVAEVSLRADVPPALLASLLLGSVG